MSLELSLCRIQDEPFFFFFFFMKVHEIWMLFISPANPDFSGQTPSTGKQLQQAKKKKRKKRWKTTEINLAASLVEHTYTRATDMEVNTRKSTLFLPQAGQQTHYYHTQTKIHTHTHTPRWGKTMHTSTGQCLPEDRRELWKLTSWATLHVHGSPQNTSHCCPSFWLPSTTPPP